MGRNTMLYLSFFKVGHKNIRFEVLCLINHKKLPFYNHSLCSRAVINKLFIAAIQLILLLHVCKDNLLYGHTLVNT